MVGWVVSKMAIQGAGLMNMDSVDWRVGFSAKFPEWSPGTLL